MYEPRTYRHWIKGTGLTCYNATVQETDLQICTSRNLRRDTLKAVRRCRSEVESYIAAHPRFLTSLEPLPVDSDAPAIVRAMQEAALAAGVGPMAAVAGAVAECVGRELLALSSEVIVENGGDIFLKSSQVRHIGIYAGSSPFTGRLSLEIAPADTPCGVCTSSGTVGHSLSFGRADAVIVVAASTPLADAAATAICNRIKAKNDIKAEIERSQEIAGVRGAVAVMGGSIGAWGDITLVPL